MAAPTKERKQVPKLFSERAKAASVQAQVALDLLEAQMKGDFAQKKAKLKAQGNMASFMGSQIDSSMQAKADRAAQGEPEPVGPELNVAPLPNASQPSQGLSGATGADLNSLLTQPGAVQGGAGIQSVTGGLGRAQPSGVDPSQLQAQVPQYNVSQTTREGTQQFGDATGVLRVPVSQTSTTVTPNTLSAYQAARLSQEQEKADMAKLNFTQEMLVRSARLGISQDKLVLEIAKTKSQLAKDASSIRASAALTGLREVQTSQATRDLAVDTVQQFGEPLANLYALALEGAMSKDEFEARKENILTSIADPELRNATETYAKTTLSTVQAERSLRGSGLAVETTPNGGVSVVQGNVGKILANKADAEMNTQRTLAFRKMQAGESGTQQIDDFLVLVKANPGLIGASGSLAKLSTNVLGAIADFVPKVQAEIVRDLTADMERIKNDPKIPMEEKVSSQETYLRAVKEINSRLTIYQPNEVGKIGVMINGLRATLAKAELGGELNIRGYEALSRDFVDPTGLKGFSGAISELESVRERFVQHANLGKADYTRMGGRSDLTSRQIIGLEPMPKETIRGPEVRFENIYSPTSAKSKPQIVTTPPPGVPVLNPEDLR